MVRDELHARNIEMISGWIAAHARAGHRVRFECRDGSSGTELVFLLSDPEAFLDLVSQRPASVCEDPFPPPVV